MPKKTEIISGERIEGIAQIHFRGMGSSYFKFFVTNPRQTGGREHRMQAGELLKILKETNFVVEPPKGNRKYPYLKPNLL